MSRNIPLELATRYARIMDDRAFDELDDIMSEDIQIGSPAFDNTSLADFRETVTILNRFSATMHLIGNQFGSWEGDTYQGETYCVASHIYEQDGVQRKWEVGIRYQDTIGPVGDAYKYTRRYLNVLWESDQPLNL